MTEVLIRLQRPARMNAEIRAWLSQRAGAGRTALALGRLERADHGELVLRVAIGAEAVDVAEQELADLLTDMRLLGLRPALVSADAR